MSHSMTYTNGKIVNLSYVDHLFLAGTVSNGLSAFSNKMKASSVLEKGKVLQSFSRVHEGPLMKSAVS